MQPSDSISTHARRLELTRKLESIYRTHVLPCAAELNALGPAAYLPDELLMMILQRALPCPHCEVKDYYRSLNHCAIVCKQWRRVILSAPQLWSSIASEFWETASHLVDRSDPTAIYLGWSGDEPITLDNEITVAASEASYEVLCNTLYHHKLRVTHISVTLPTAQLVQLHFLMQFGISCSNLSTLILCDENSGEHILILTFDFLCRLPALRTLSLKGKVIVQKPDSARPDGFPAFPIERLCLEYDSELPFSLWTCESLLELLSYFSNAQALVIKSTADCSKLFADRSNIDGSALPNESLLAMPHLTDLRIENVDYLSPISKLPWILSLSSNCAVRYRLPYPGEYYPESDSERDFDDSVADTQTRAGRLLPWTSRKFHISRLEIENDMDTYHIRLDMGSDCPFSTLAVCEEDADFDAEIDPEHIDDAFRTDPMHTILHKI